MHEFGEFVPREPLTVHFARNFSIRNGDEDIRTVIQCDNRWREIAHEITLNTFHLKDAYHILF